MTFDHVNFTHLPRKTNTPPVHAYNQQKMSKRKPPPWGPVVSTVSSADTTKLYTTIPGLTFLYITGNIPDADTYAHGMDAVLLGILLRATDELYEDSLVEAINEKLYGKTPLQMLVAMELALTMTTAKFPEVAFRTHLTKTMKGIRALYDICGDFVDISDDIVDDWGLSIAGNCMYLQSNFYTQKTCATGHVSCVPNNNQQNIAIFPENNQPSLNGLARSRPGRLRLLAHHSLTTSSFCGLVYLHMRLQTL
ncbi:hypothetical protein T484DRAFT_3632802 [Baffinella frigidus]|nr:hypothetical protein T484DRAFT_3632802 [Cryptophyta sp. CCMP2293]